MNHEIKLDHDYLSSKRRVWVDGIEQNLPSSDKQPSVDWGGDLDYKIGEHLCRLAIRSNGLTYNYDLIVDGISNKTGKQYAGKEFKPNYSNNLVWWGKIETKETADMVFKNVFSGLLTASGITATVLTLLGNFRGWIDFTIFLLLGLWLKKKRSTLAAIILVTLCLFVVISTFVNRVNKSQVGVAGGGNVILALLMVFLSIRGLQAALWYRNNKSASQ